MPASVTALNPPEPDYGGDTATWTYKGVHYLFREVTVEENDACIDAALTPDGNSINNRTMTRLLILKSTVEPKGFTLTDLVRLPYRAYEHIREMVNDLNDPDRIPTDPNDSTPDGSDAQK